MLTIRLQRTGKKNQADFRIVLAEKEAPVKKKVVEVLGSYNPRKKNFQVKEERLKYWLEQRVQVSPTLQNLLITKNLFAGAKVKAFNIPKKPASVEASDSTKASSDEAAGKPAETEVQPDAGEAIAISEAEKPTETAVPEEQLAEAPKAEEQAPAEEKKE